MQRIVLAGAGYVGLVAARRLERLLRPDEAEIVVVNPENFMLFRPLLPEVASGAIEPRHAVVPLRDVLRGSRTVPGSVTGIDTDDQVVTIDTAGGEEELGWDHIAFGVGAMTRVLPVPGLAERAFGFSTIAEALGLRNHVLQCLERAETLTGEDRRRALTFVFVGGGYTGVEALGELHDMAVDVLAGYPGLATDELRFVLVEATDRLLSTVGDDLAEHARSQLAERGVDIRLETRIDSVDGADLALSDGSSLAADTLVWVTGLVPHPVVGELGLPTEEDSGRLVVDARLRVSGYDGVWAAGDCAAVPDVVEGGTCPPTAQHALRQGRQLGDNLAAAVRGRSPEEFRHRSLGEFVTLGVRQGVAEVMGRQLAGLPAWLLRRGYYASQIPTLNRKTRLLLDWVVGMPFGHDVVDLSAEQDPRAPFRAAAAPVEGAHETSR